jgi:hypothetical protein
MQRKGSRTGAWKDKAGKLKNYYRREPMNNNAVASDITKIVRRRV